jgi:hypothetical protein
VRNISEVIEAEVGRWPGVGVGQHRFGGLEFRLHGKELGHLHGDRLADLPFPKRIRNDLVATKRAFPHHVLSQSGWVSFWIKGAQDVPQVIDLFRLNYDRYTQRPAPTRTAYLLITAEEGLETLVIQELQALFKVIDVNRVRGPYDLIAEVQVGAGDATLELIESVPGVKRVVTSLGMSSATTERITEPSLAVGNP